MEWVETTAKTLEEAKDLALDRLGVAADEAEFEILEEPRAGLFGRMRGEARVRARVMPTAVRPKQDRRRGRGKGDGKRSGQADGTGDASGDAKTGDAKSGDGTSGDGKAGEGKARDAKRGGRGKGESRPSGVAPDRSSDTGTEPAGDAAAEPAVEASAERQPESERTSTSRNRRSSSSKQQKEQQVSTDEARESQVTPQDVGDAAQAFMAGLADAFGATAETSVEIDGSDIDVRVTGSELGLMVGHGGRTLLAIQDLARVASQRRLGDHDTRLRIDVGGYREKRREALERFAVAVAHQVVESGTPKALEPMQSADRKIVHDALAGVEGVTSRSEGDDPMRRVVISPA